MLDAHLRFLHRFGLRNRAREAVEQEAVRAIGLLDAFLDQPDDDVIGNQTAGIHMFFCSDSKRAAGFDGGAHMSPVEIWGMRNRPQMKAACVPLPAPGAPNKINLIVSSLKLCER